MAESIESPKVRAPEPVTINVLRARNLRGQRGDQVTVLVKVEFSDKSLGESSKENCSLETPAELNYSTTLNIGFEDPASLDEIATKPVLFTVIEVLPKEKKSKKEEEKTVILGQCTVDLLPLLQGEKSRKITSVIHPIAGSPLENLPADHPKPEIDVAISVNEPLLNETSLEDANLLSITVESLYSPPDSWQLTGQQYMYTAGLPLPVNAEKEHPVVFAGGTLNPGVEKLPPNKQKKWGVPGGAQGNSVYIPEQMIAGDSIDEEDGDFRGKDDREHRYTAEQEKNRVVWNIDRRCYMDSSATKCFQDKIAKCRYWPLEVMRTSLPSGAKTNKKEDDGHIGFHGVVYLDLAPLLYPGVKRIRGAYKIMAYNDQELNEKAHRKASIAEESVKIATGIISRTSSSPFPKAGKKEEASKAVKEPKKGKKGEVMPQPPGTSAAFYPKDPYATQPSMMKASDSASEAEGPIVNVEGMQYVEAKSYLMIDMTLHRPLVRKRPPEELGSRVAEYIPPRPIFPVRTDGAERAVEDYHNQVSKVVDLLLDEFRELYGDEMTSGKASTSPEAMEERRQKFMYHLNTSGKYFAFKEQMKHSIVKIVREKYLRTSTMQEDDLQAFITELYVYLLDQMHIALNKALAVEDQSPIPAPLTTSAQLKHFAREAEVNENFDLATTYYEERIARDGSDPDHYLDYGTFCLYINQLTKAEECFKECVSIDQRHLEGLLLYGVVCTMQDKHEAAETFFEAATSFYPTSILAWTMLGLFYSGIGNEIGEEMALIEANKLNVAEAAEAQRQAREDAARATAPPGTAGGASATALAEEDESAKNADASVAGPAPGDDHHTDSLQTGSPRDLKQATPVSQAGSGTKVVAAAPAPPPAGAMGRKNSAAQQRKSGKIRNMEGGSRPVSQARSPNGPVVPGAEGAEATTEETAAPREPSPPTPKTSIFMYIMDFLLDVKAMPFTERALAHHLVDPLGGTSADYHIALARLKLQQRKMEEAEDSLKDALQFDHQNPDAWAILGHVKYLLGETDVAKDCYERTLAFVADASEMHSIYLRLASIYLQEGKFADAKKTFLYACKRSPSCVSWLGVGIACYRLMELNEAEDALSQANILNNHDPEVWAYLSLVCLRTGRQFEAEQGYKYAMKLNLNDQDLLNEIHHIQEEVGFGNPQL